MAKGIVAAGNWVLDLVKTIDRWPGVGELCNILNLERAGGGGPCNVLFDLAAMGGGVPLYAAGLLGCDADGEWLWEETRKRGIDVRFLGRTSRGHTSFSDVMSGGGKRTFFHCRGANALLDIDDLAGIDVDAKIFYLGYLLLLDQLDREDGEFGTRAAHLLHFMREKKMLTVVDTVSEAPEKFRRVILPALPEIDVLVINELEAGNTWSLPVRRLDGTIDRKQLECAAEAFLQHGVQRMVVIHFPEGALVRTALGEICWKGSCDVPRGEIIGTNGAGDAFCAGILYALHEELSLERMLTVAAASAAFNLRNATASGGAVSLERMEEYWTHCSYTVIPQ